MASFGINSHAHIDASVFAVVLTLLTYLVKWVFGLRFPDFVLVLPTFLAIFIGFYIILWVVFLIAWNRK